MNLHEQYVYENLRNILSIATITEDSLKTAIEWAKSVYIVVETDDILNGTTVIPNRIETLVVSIKQSLSMVQSLQKELELMAENFAKTEQKRKEG